MISYFIFTKEQKGLLGPPAKLARWFILAALGASFGGNVMGRLATLVPRMQSILEPDSRLATLVATILVVVVLGYRFMKRKEKT